MSAGPLPNIQPVPLAAIRRDATQTRAGLNGERVSHYAERIKEGDRFPAPVLFFDGAEYWAADGFHRLEAYARTLYGTIECDVREGGRADAILFGAGANARHDKSGLYRSNADKRHSVVMVFGALALKGESWTDTRIAELCGLSHVLVGECRAKLVAATGQPDDTPRVGRNGKTYKAPKAPAQREAVSGSAGRDAAITHPDVDSAPFERAEADCRDADAAAGRKLAADARAAVGAAVDPSGPTADALGASVSAFLRGVYDRTPAELRAAVSVLGEIRGWADRFEGSEAR